MNTMRKFILIYIVGSVLFSSTVLAQTNEGIKDLALEWANFTEEGIVFSVKNEGEVDIAGRLETVFEWLQCGGAEMCKRTKNVFTLVRDENIKKGERLILESKNVSELQAWIKNKPFGVDKVRIEIDPANKIKEEREDNNAWEEAPISPRTSGERLAKRDEYFKDVSTSPKILPGNKLYILKDVWRNVRMALTFGEERRIQKRLELIRERLVEIQKLAELGKGKKIPNILEKIGEEWKKVKESKKAEELSEQIVKEGLKVQLILEDVENNAAGVSAEETRKELLSGIGESIRALKSDEKKKQAVREGLEERNKSPLFSIKQIKILRLLESVLPEEKSLREIEEEFVDTLELRVLYLPEDVRSGISEYAVSIHKDKDDALELLGHIEETAGIKLRKASETKGSTKSVETPKAAPKKSSGSSEEKPKDVKTKEPEEEKILCTAEYAPVCGEDDVTYSNACVAEEQNKIKIAYKGECKLPKPDLYIKKTEILPENPRENDYLSIRANVTNDGGTAQKLFRTRMRIDADINGIYDVIPNEYPLNLIRTSSTKSIAWENVWQAKEGVHRIELCVDSGRAIVELNEENNCTILAFEVGPRATSTDTTATSTETLSTSTGVGS